MIILAFILGLLGLLGLMASICIGVYIAWRKPAIERPLPTGLYRITVIGRNRLTNAVEYKFDLVEEEKKEEVKTS
jgi:hypothetical protein